MLLKSLKYVIVISHFLYLNRKAISSKENSDFLRLLLAFSNIFVFKDGQTNEGEK